MDIIGYVKDNCVIVTASNTPDLLEKFFLTAKEYFQTKDEVNVFEIMMDEHFQQISGPVYRFDCGSPSGVQSFVNYYGIEILRPQQAINKNAIMVDRGIQDKHDNANSMFTIGQIHGITTDDPWDKRSMHEKNSHSEPKGSKSRNDEMMTSDDSFSNEPAIKSSMGAHLLDNEVDNIVASVIRKVDGDEKNAILKMKFGFISQNFEVNWTGTSVTGESFINLLGDLATKKKYTMLTKAGEEPSFEVELMDQSFSSAAIMNADRNKLSTIFPHDHKEA